ncbi:hypothetical protein FACS189440_11830 [Bacteroidia bacterium]|nr:hypothetical protein FACS189440_11830 [Bacteroidia bacterium]
MKIICDVPGQLCNRLWSYLDTIAWSVLNKQRTVILFIDSNIQYFDKLRNNNFISFPLYNKKVFNLLGYNLCSSVIGKIFNNKLFRLFYCSTVAEKFGFIIGWKKRADSSFFPICKKEVLQLYKPNDNITEYVDGVIRQIRIDDVFIIGIHIRKGDYKTWMGGEYYYTDEDYALIMRNLEEYYQNKKVYFFLSSNESVRKECFDGLNILKMNNFTAVHDLYTLSCCDRIIGPLSTFSRWASLYGNVPLCYIQRNKEKYVDSDFSIIKDFYHFENGEEIINLTDKKA